MGKILEEREVSEDLAVTRHLSPDQSCHTGQAFSSSARISREPAKGRPEADEMKIRGFSSVWSNPVSPCPGVVLWHG